MDKLVLNGTSIDPRVTTKQIRRLKSQHQIDLADVSENSLTIRFSTDATVVLDIAYALYGPQMPADDCKSQADFDDFIDEELEKDPNYIVKLRSIISEAISGFFPLLKTVSTTMESVQAGAQAAAEEAVEQKASLSGSTS